MSTFISTDIKWTPRDHWRQTLSIECDRPKGKLSADIEIRQPCGYTQHLVADRVAWELDRAKVEFVYPLIDDGRFDPAPGTWQGEWLMGEYAFNVALSDDSREVVRQQCVLPVNDLYPRHPDSGDVIPVSASTQLIECAPCQSLYTDEIEAEAMIRIHQHRLADVEAVMDVVERAGERVLAGPWRLALGHKFQHQRFAVAGWSDGEYWLRIRLLRDGKPVGAYCVRKFWKQAPLPDTSLEPLALNGQPETMVDGYCFSQVGHVRFAPLPQVRSESPQVNCTEPYEDELLYIDSLEWNDQDSRFECVYHNAGAQKNRRAGRDERQHFKMLAVSDDGEHWHKPQLNKITFAGNNDNNVLRDDRDAPDAKEQEIQHDIEHATFRFYDATRDGSIDMDHVFVASGKKHFPFRCKSIAESTASAFQPNGGEFWPFEKRGDEYLVLTRQPVLYLGAGMDLMHTTESIRCHVETTHRGQKRLLYYFRPGSPAYLPHAAPYDNMHMCLRCLGVMWTDDGVTYHRRFVIGPDMYDPIGTQFYGMAMIQRLGTQGGASGRPVLDKLVSKINQAFPERNLHLGLCLLHWGIEQKQAPELIWTRDFIQFHRFGRARRSFIALGPAGSFDGAMIRPRHQYVVVGDEWWHCYTGINTRHNGYTVLANCDSADAYRQRFTNHSLAPYFDTWEGAFADGMTTRYLPGLAKGKAYRVACAEPLSDTGELVTRPLLVQQPCLRLNAKADADGSVLVQGQDEGGVDLPNAQFTFRGDEVDALTLDTSTWIGRTMRFKFTLDRAQLFAFLV